MGAAKGSNLSVKKKNMLRAIHFFYFAFLLLFGNCAPKQSTVKTSHNATVDVMTPSPYAQQAFEGRLTYEEQQILENQTAQTRRRFVLAFFGIRTHERTQHGIRIHDTFSGLRRIESEPSAQIPSEFQVQFDFSHQGSEFIFQIQPRGALHWLAIAMERIYPAAHFVFSNKIHQYNEEFVRIPMNIMVAGQVFRTVRPFLFRVQSWRRTSMQNEISLRGEYVSTDLGTLQLGEFSASCVGKAEIEADFQLDSGVWTRIDAKEILGWATYVQDIAIAPVQVGYRVILHLQIQLTDIQNKRK